MKTNTTQTFNTLWANINHIRRDVSKSNQTQVENLRTRILIEFLPNHPTEAMALFCILGDDNRDVDFNNEIVKDILNRFVIESLAKELNQSENDVITTINTELEDIINDSVLN